MQEQEALLKVRIFLRKEGVIMPKGPIREFYSQIFRLSGFGIGALFNFSGKKAGKTAGQYLKDIIEKENPTVEETAHYVEIFLREAGICKVESLSFENGKLVFKTKDSIFAESMENKKPVCIPLSGALAGLFEEVLGGEWECKEIECQAQGKEFCIFEVVKKK